jgi:hypothetical protein
MGNKYTKCDAESGFEEKVKFKFKLNKWKLKTNSN